MSQIDHIMDQVSQLSPDERLELRIRLLDAELGPEDSDAESAWAEEIRRRVAAYRRGEVELVPAAHVLKEARDLVAKIRD